MKDTGYHYFFIHAKDDVCPINGNEEKAFTIYVSPPVKKPAYTVKTAGCGQFDLKINPVLQNMNYTWKASVNAIVKTYSGTSGSIAKLYIVY